MFSVCCASLNLVHNYDISKSNDLGLISVYLFSMTSSFETVNESMIKQLSPWASFRQLPESSYKQPLIVFLYYSRPVKCVKTLRPGIYRHLQARSFLFIDNRKNNFRKPVCELRYLNKRRINRGKLVNLAQVCCNFLFQIRPTNRNPFLAKR
jgi:hypothetical protein